MHLKTSSLNLCEILLHSLSHLCELYEFSSSLRASSSVVILWKLLNSSSFHSNFSSMCKVIRVKVTRNSCNTPDGRISWSKLSMTFEKMVVTELCERTIVSNTNYVLITYCVSPTLYITKNYVPKRISRLSFYMDTLTLLF